MTTLTAQRAAPFVFLIVLASFGVRHGFAASGTPAQWWQASRRNETAFLNALRPILKSTRGIRVYYRATCNAAEGEGEGTLFPRLKLSAPHSNSPVEAIREILRGNEGITVTADRRVGIIRIRIGHFSGDLLQTKVSSVSLDSLQQYNGSEAVGALTRAAEVQRSMQRLGITEPPLGVFGRVLDPAPGLPHLPKRLEHLTLDQALDVIARTFNGIVEYAECTGPAKTHAVQITIDEP